MVRLLNQATAAPCEITDAFETCRLGHQTDAATNQGVEAAAGSLDFVEQHRIGIGRPRVGCIDGEPHLHPAALDPQRELLGEDATLQSGSGELRSSEPRFRSLSVPLLRCRNPLLL